MDTPLIIDDIRFYVWALSRPWPSNPNGYDIRYMAGGYDDVTQADLVTIDALLEGELTKNVEHQVLTWHWLDGAINAIGMMEADGYTLDKGFTSAVGMRNFDAYEQLKNTRDNEAYISLVKGNVGKRVDYLRGQPIMFEAVATDPDGTGTAAMDLTMYAYDILARNGYSGIRENLLSDMAAFGSGVIEVSYAQKADRPDDAYFEERMSQGMPMSAEEYRRYVDIQREHTVRWVDTFSVIRDRHARGAEARSFNSPAHKQVDILEPARVAALRLDYPDRADDIHAAVSEQYMRSNPRAIMSDEVGDMATRKTTYVRCPVRYETSALVMTPYGTMERKAHTIRRNAIIKVVRVENVGIVDMCVDEYYHHQFPLEQVVDNPSSKSACGFGACKLGHDAERIFNVMLNGKLRYLGRMVKGGGFVYKGAMSQDDLERRTDEGAYVEIDLEGLPPELQTMPIQNLVYDNRPTSFPSVYSELMSQAEYYGDRVTQSPNAGRGVQQGTSARHDMFLAQQAEQSMSGSAQNYEDFMVPFGGRVFSNIVQFDRDNEVRFVGVDGAEHVLNEMAGQYDVYDEELDEHRVLPIIARNNLQTLRYTTKPATRSLMPHSPTEQRLFMQGFITNIGEMVRQGGMKELILIKYLVRHGYGGLPGAQSLIDELTEAVKLDMMMAMQSMQAEQTGDEFDRRSGAAQKNAELAQNNKRLDQHYAIKMAELAGKDSN